MVAIVVNFQKVLRLLPANLCSHLMHQQDIARDLNGQKIQDAFDPKSATSLSLAVNASHDDMLPTSSSDKQIPYCAPCMLLWNSEVQNLQFHFQDCARVWVSQLCGRSMIRVFFR